MYSDSTFHTCMKLEPFIHRTASKVYFILYFVKTVLYIVDSSLQSLYCSLSRSNVIIYVLDMFIEVTKF